MKTIEDCSMPREKLAKLGPEQLSDAELLAVLLRTGVKGTPVLQMAEKLIRAFSGSLLGLCDATPGELCKIQGMGMAKSLELCAAFALGKRLAMQRIREKPDMSNPGAIARFMKNMLMDEKRESFHVLLLDCKLKLLRAECISIGLVDRSLVHSREVFRSAIKESCSSIILCHNHPSGNVTPSKADIEVTKMLASSGKIIGITVVDHIILGCRLEPDAPEYFSFLEKGIMPQ